MFFNCDIFDCISFGRGETQHNYLSPSEESIVYRDSLQDLGVIMLNDCTFRPNIQKCNNQGQQDGRLGAKEI
jgi:hypothetical protein